MPSFRKFWIPISFNRKFEKKKGFSIKFFGNLDVFYASRLHSVLKLDGN